jgi:hypothetical protein
MRKLLSKRFEAVASILIVAAFAAVAMALNGGKLAFFGKQPATNLTDIDTVRDTQPIYAKNIWRGKSIWTPVMFAADGSLEFKDLIKQMYEKTFSPQLREGSSDLPHYVHIVARHKDGTVFLDAWAHNLRTNAGINWQYGQMAGTTANVCNYIALSNTAITPNATDTTLSGEITANGLQRAGPITSTTYNVHTSNATSYTLQNIFTCATATQAAQAAAVFNDTHANGGTMCFENTFTQASLQVGDTLTVTWTITF